MRIPSNSRKQSQWELEPMSSESYAVGAGPSVRLEREVWKGAVSSGRNREAQEPLWESSRTWKLSCPLLSQKLRGSLAAGGLRACLCCCGVSCSQHNSLQQLLPHAWVDQKSQWALLAFPLKSQGIETKVSIWWDPHLQALGKKPLPRSSKLVAEFYS